MSELGYRADGEPTEKQIQLQDALDSAAVEYLVEIEKILAEFEIKHDKKVTEHNMTYAYNLNHTGLLYFGLSFEEIY